MHGNAIHEYKANGDWGRFLAILLGIRYAVFTVGGPDFISLTAAEVVNPRRNVPRVSKLIVWRIVGFYFAGAIAVGLLCPSRDPALLEAIADGKSGANASPWVIGMQNVGISGFLPGFINFIILMSGWSCGNAFLYTSSRTLYGLAQDGQAPKIFLRCTKRGVPWVCVTAVTLISCVTFMVTSTSALQVFLWFVDLTTSGIIVYHTGFWVVALAWRRALVAQNVPTSQLPWKAFFPTWWCYYGIAFGTLIYVFLGFTSWKPFDYQSFITSYFAGPWALILFVLWAVIKRTHFVKPVDADIFSGKAEIDQECRHWEEGEDDEKARLAQMNFFRRTWERMWS